MQKRIAMVIERTATVQIVRGAGIRLLMSLFATALLTVSNAQSLTWLGTLGGNVSQAYAVSSNGTVVVGYTQDSAGRARAFRWTDGGGMQDLGTFGGSHSWAWSVSADGFVVVGWSSNSAGESLAFR